MRAAVVFLFFVGASAFFDAEETFKEKPIQKVIRLLNEMAEQLKKEAAEDEETMDGLGCWCDTNDKEKSKAISVANQRLTDLGAAIEEYTAKSAQLKTDLESLKKQVAEETASLNEQTALREKEATEFHESEKDAIVNLGSLKGAILTLGKVHGDAALSQESLAQVKQVLALRHTKKHVMSFLQQPMDEAEALLEEARGGAPQSGAIFGIMKQMKESFETNLATSQKDEESAKTEFASMKESKSSGIKSAEELIDSKTTELADTDSKLAASKEDQEDTSAQLKADTEFLASLREKCANADKDYAARSKVRNEEIQAVGETIGILTDDDAKDLMGKSFLQMSSRTVRMVSSKRDRASAFLRDAAQRLGKPKLAALAISMKNDVFAKVKQNIDNMVTALKKTQKDEVDQKDFCIKEFHQNEMMTTEKTNKKEDLTNEIADLSTAKSTLAEEIEQLKAETAQTHVEMKQASENRKKENAEFQLTVTDAKATQAILDKALNRLKDFYAKKVFLQVHAKQPGYKKNSGASSVMTMIENIIEESKDLEKESLADENKGQAAYEAFIEESNAALDALAKSVVSKSEELAGVDGKKAQAEGDLAKTNEALLKLSSYNLELHQTCDFVVKFFDVRQQKRAEEIEALQQAKQIFSGADFGL